MTHFAGWPDGLVPAVAIQAADTAWMLVATAMVLLMTGALAFFYGGLVRTRSALNTMAMSVVSFGFVGLAWAVLGYSLAFGGGSSLVGDTSMAFLRGVDLEAKGTVPHLLFMVFQGTFAIITAALISGAVVERMRFSAYVAFITLWSVVVYAPVAHWVWAEKVGWLSAVGSIDFAGGTVVHVNAGIAAVVAAAVLGPRRDYGRRALLPHNVPYVLLGAVLLWFGWFGFNGGSALAANPSAVLAFVNTALAPAGTLVVWTLLDLARHRKITVVGMATGIVVGLVVVTPAAGFISPMAAIVLGMLGALPSYFMILWRSTTRLDDSLDVFSAHGVGGIFGALMTGVFCQASWGAPADGLLHGNLGQVGLQALGVAATLLYSATATFGLLKLVGSVIPLRAEVHDEGRGLDVTLHGEEAYTRGEGALLMLPSEVRSPVAKRPQAAVVPLASEERPPLERAS